MSFVIIIVLGRRGTLEEKTKWNSVSLINLRGLGSCEIFTDGNILAYEEDVVFLG